MNSSEWFDRLAPTPGMSARTAMPCSRRCAAGPMPQRISMAGEWMPPKLTMVSRPVNSRASPPMVALTPVARRPSNAISVTVAPLMMVRLFRRAHVGGEIADRRRGPLVRPVADRHCGVAVAEIRVHVGNVGVLPLVGEILQHLRQRRPLILRRAPDRHRAVAAVHAAAEVEIVLELLEERQHVVPAPAGGAKLLPFGVVVRRAAERHHPHDRGAAAHDATLRIAGQRRIAGEPPVHLQLRPEIGGVVVGRRIGIEHVGGLAAGRRVAAGFEQQHGMARARREPIRQHAAGGAAADDDGVEIVGSWIRPFPAAERNLPSIQACRIGWAKSQGDAMTGARSAAILAATNKRIGRTRWLEAGRCSPQALPRR